MTNPLALLTRSTLSQAGTKISVERRVKGIQRKSWSLRDCTMKQRSLKWRDPFCRSPSTPRTCRMSSSIAHSSLKYPSLPSQRDTTQPSCQQKDAKVTPNKPRNRKNLICVPLSLSWVSNRVCKHLVSQTYSTNCSKKPAFLIMIRCYSRRSMMRNWKSSAAFSLTWKRLKRPINS